MLEIKKLSKTYKNNIKAIDNVCIEVKSGEIHGFIGPNGAGKTTTIKAVVGILDFEEGEIIIDGKSIKENPFECKKEIAYIPDNPDIYDNLSGIQYLNFIADLFEVEPEKREELINKYAELFEIKESLGDIVSSYSHGMKQKLAIISALIHEPKLLILDEPFVGLDPKAAFKLKEIMRSLCKEGMSIFFSTHVLEVAQKLCDSVSIIKNGKIVVQGNIEEVVKTKSLEDVFMELV
ncbi:MAG: ABC transporter ATP-binding protein [Clostridia bacterium]